MNNSLKKRDYEMLAEFRYQLRKFMRFSENATRSVGITPNQHQLLLAIEGFPNRNYATPGELAERLQVKHHSCLGLIQRCEQIGLIIRFENPHDKRSIFIKLTEHGKNILEQLTLMHQNELETHDIRIPYISSKEFTQDKDALPE